MGGRGAGGWLEVGLRGAVDVEGWAGQHGGLTRIGRGTYLEKGVYLLVMWVDNG